MAKIKSVRIQFLDAELLANNNNDDYGRLPPNKSPTSACCYHPGGLVCGLLQVELGDFALTRIRPTSMFAFSKPRATIAEDEEGLKTTGHHPSRSAGSAEDLSAATEQAEQKPGRRRRPVSESSASAKSLAGSKTTKSRVSIRTRLEGYGKTQWRGPGGIAEQANVFIRTEDVFLQEIADFSIPPGSPLGIHTFQFKFRLPEENLPPSFEGKYGFVRYRVRVKYGALADVRAHFSVRLNDLDLDDPLVVADEETEAMTSRSMLAPFSGSTECKQDLLGCIPYGLQEVRAEIDRRLFHFEGDVVRLSATLRNTTPRAARPLVKLIQRQSYHARSLLGGIIKTHLAEWPLSPTADVSALHPNEVRRWTAVSCTLPVVAPSFRSAVIDVDYFVEVSLVEKVALAQSPLVSLGIVMANCRRLLKCLNFATVASTSSTKKQSQQHQKAGRSVSLPTQNAAKTGSNSSSSTTSSPAFDQSASVAVANRRDASFISDLQSPNSLPMIVEVDRESLGGHTTTNVSGSDDDDDETADQVFIHQIKPDKTDHGDERPQLSAKKQQEVTTRNFEQISELSE